MKTELLMALRAAAILFAALTTSCAVLPEAAHETNVPARTEGTVLMHSCPHGHKVCAAHGQAVCCERDVACCEDHHGRPYCGSHHGCH